MYFEIAKKFNINFPKFYKIKNFCVSTDLGWKQMNGRYGDIIYKGYAYEDLEAFLRNHDPSTLLTPRGSFTAIMSKDDKVYIVSDNSRQYPIFVNPKDTILTNLTKHDTVVYADVSLCIDCGSGEVQKHYHKTLFEKQVDVSLTDTSSMILQTLNSDISYFKNTYKNPIKVIPTGGIDSTLLIALLKHNNVDFEVIDYEYKKWTYFYKKNRKEVDENIPSRMFMKVGHSWGEQPTTLANGWHADQHFFRLYLPFIVFCKMKSLDFKETLEANKDSYSYDKLKHKIGERMQDSLSVIDGIVDLESGYNKIFEIIRASFQPWTFEQTLYWSPYKNIEITKHILQMNDDDVIKNTMEASVQRHILEQIDPNLLDVITPTKNEFDKTVYDKFTKTLTNY